LRKDNGRAIRKVCARFVELCRAMGLLTTASVAIDGSKFVLAEPSFGASAMLLCQSGASPVHRRSRPM